MLGIKHLSHSTGADFRFLLYKPGIEPRSTVSKTVVLPLDNLRTYQDVLLQLLHILLDTEYNTPHVFCLAGYSTALLVSPHRFYYCATALPFLARSDLAITH